MMILIRMYTNRQIKLSSAVTRTTFFQSAAVVLAVETAAATAVGSKQHIDFHITHFSLMCWTHKFFIT